LESFPSSSDKSSGGLDASTNSRDSFTSDGHGTLQGNSITELNAGFAVIPPLGPERQQVTHKLRQRFMDVNDKYILQRLPRDNGGRVLHESGTHRICRAMVAGQLCSNGMRYGFCHYPRDIGLADVVVKTGAGDKKQGGTRLCKAKRDMCKKYVQRMTDQICADPWSFDPTTVHLPPKIFDGRPEEVKNKFLIWLSALAESAKTDSLEAAADRSASNTAESRIQAINTASIRQADHFSSNNSAGSSSPRSSHELLADRSKKRNIVSV